MHKLVGIMLFSVSTMFSMLSLANDGPDKQHDMPMHLARVNSDSLFVTSLTENRLLMSWSEGQTTQYQFTLPLFEDILSLSIPKVIINTNGNLSFSHTFAQDLKPMQIIYTQGKGVGMGELIGAGKHLYFEQRGSNLYVVDISQSGLLPGLYQNDALGDNLMRPVLAAKATAQNAESTVVDIMLLYTQNILNTFPGEMTQTLLNQLVLKANQAFVDSDINMQLRLVRSEFVDYPEPSDITAINDLAFALESPNASNVQPSLQNVADLREQFGADIVAMIRTHNLNEREVCGIARFPSNDSDVLINISNVGISGGSNCIDTFTHEIGHNFGAGHQEVNGESVGALGFSGALIQRGKFNTIMSSIGTGDINRNFKLNVFSNPNKQCGGVPCGDVGSADNARTINTFAAVNAGLRDSVLDDVVTAPEQSLTDRDGDGVLDTNDAFPHDPAETADSDLDNVGDNGDAFPTDSSESLDTDQDGIGNNIDTDDDGDGVPDNQDDLPLNANETIDSDGDNIGANIDALEDNFQEFQDNDLDGVGDRADRDDDNDGVADFVNPDSLSKSELWVASAGSDSILRYDPQTGVFVGQAFEAEEGSFSFRTDMLLSPSQQLYFIAFSDVYSFDRQTNLVRKEIDRSLLQSNFPAHLSFDNQQNLIVNNGLAPSLLEEFAFTNTGNNFLSSARSDEVLRDMHVFQTDRLLVLSRTSNQILSYNINNLNAAPGVFAREGLDKPEHMAIDAQSNVYVTNAGNRTVSRFSSTGSFLGEFIAAGAGGLGMPGCIGIGPDGGLYVCSTDTHQILKFDGQSGAFMQTLIDSGDSGLNTPVGLVFVGNPLDELPFNAQHDSDSDGVNNDEDAFPLNDTESIDTDGDGTGNNADTDDDNDGMPDSFELDNGLDPVDSADASRDADGDGSSNLAEFQAGTDPNSGDSVPPPPIQPITDNGGGGSSHILFLFWAMLTLMLRQRKTHRNIIG